MNTWLTRRPRRPFCLSITLLAILVSVLAHGAGQSAQGEARLTVDIQEQLLSEALNLVASLTGRPIELIGPVDERRVTVSLRAATLEESLERILHPSSYTVIWLTDGGLAIHVLDEAGDGPGVTGEPPTRPEDEFDTPISLFPGDDEVLPPSQPGAHGLTARDIEYYASFRTPPDPSEEEVLPPDSPEDWGMTKEELNFLTQPPVPSPSEVELVPPQGDAGFGLTMAELEAMRSASPSLTPSQIEVLPPDEPGGTGLTFEQLESMNRARPSHLPLSLGDMIPPD